MSWSGDFKIIFNGKNQERFHKLAKMIIPNSIERFDFDNIEVAYEHQTILSSTRNLSWYTADYDMAKLLSYMPDENRGLFGYYVPFLEQHGIVMEIEGEGQWEEVGIDREKGKIKIIDDNKTDRYRINELGIVEMLREEFDSRYQPKSDENSITSLDGYIQFIANTFADDKELIPIVQDFMYEVLDKDLILEQNDEKIVNYENHIKLDKLREKFSTVESTNKFLSEHKNNELSYKSEKKQNIDELPEWVKQFPKSVINSLGGAALLKQLIESKGEAEARNVVEFLGNGILSEREMEDDEYDDNSESFVDYGSRRR